MPDQEASLTPREVEVLRLVADGRTGRQIAEILGVTVRTAHAHTESIIAKLGASNRTHAVAIAIRDGIVAMC